MNKRLKPLSSEAPLKGFARTAIITMLLAGFIANLGAQINLEASLTWPHNQAGAEIAFDTQRGKTYWIDQTLNLKQFASLGNVRGTGERLVIALPSASATTQFYRIQELDPLISASALTAYRSPEPDAIIAYGESHLQYGKLRLPKTQGPHPVVIFVHGGCWLSAFDIKHTGPLEDALANEGYAVWSLEYRRVGDDGGGWPGSFQDIGQGADHLREIATEHHLDLTRVIASGHSAGGHFALWLAARHQVPHESDIHSPDPLPIHAVVGLAPAPDLEGLYESRTCGHVINGLMAGSPTDFPERYASASPMQLAPIAVPQKHLIGLRDTSWAPVGRAYFDHARNQGDTQIEVITAYESGHFEMITPSTSTWPIVRKAFEATLETLTSP